MDIHVYDVNCEKDNVVVVSGRSPHEDMQTCFDAIKKIVGEDRVIYIPPDNIVDGLSKDDLIGILRDAMSLKALKTLSVVVECAIEIKEAASNEV